MKFKLYIIFSLSNLWSLTNCIIEEYYLANASENIIYLKVWFSQFKLWESTYKSDLLINTLPNDETCWSQNYV